MARRKRIWSDSERAALLAELAESGMSVAAFAREHGMSAWTIYSWRRQERERQQVEEGERSPFIQVRLSRSPRATAPLAIELREGLRVHVPTGFDEHDLRRLLGVLASC